MFVKQMAETLALNIVTQGRPYVLVVCNFGDEGAGITPSLEVQSNFPVEAQRMILENAAEQILGPNTIVLQAGE